MAPPVNPRNRRPKERVYRKGHCCWCGEPLPPPPSRRTSWCSDQCVREYLDGDPKELRRRVEDRDHGVCSACGRDCRALRGRIKERLEGAYGNDVRLRIRASKWARLLSRLKLSGRGGYFSVRTLWEADHIVPVVEGGANELANLRTLCLPCHKAETRKLAARRAEQRRAGPPEHIRRPLARALAGVLERAKPAGEG